MEPVSSDEDGESTNWWADTEKKQGGGHDGQQGQEEAHRRADSAAEQEHARPSKTNPVAASQGQAVGKGELVGIVSRRSTSSGTNRT